MRYMSVDIETTGLTPTIHGITEFAAILGDTENPNFPIAKFYRWLNPEGYVWSNYCLSLHAHWICRVTHRLATKQIEENDTEPKICSNIVDLATDFMAWFEQVDLGAYDEFKYKKRGSIVGTGKNFGTFDLQFLKAWKFPDVFRHRTLEWLPLYTRKGDKVPPDLKLCKQRAIEMGCPDLIVEVAHNALDDAMDVHKLIQFAETYGYCRLTTLDNSRG